MEMPRRFAPAPAPAPKAVTQVRLSADVLFDFDKTEIKPEGTKKLDELLANLKSTPFELVIVTGHTDAIGTDAYNDRLSLARAESVRGYLVSKGLESNRIQAAGKGESQPVADNDTDEGRSRNRRVEIEVVPPGAKPR